MKSNLRALTAAGLPLDAAFSIAGTRSGFEIIIESRSGAKRGDTRQRNRDYEKLFTLVLERAAVLGSALSGAWVASSETAHLAAASRKLAPDGLNFPFDLGLIDDLDELRVRLSRMQGAIGRKPGAKGPGNRNKRVLLRFRLAGQHSEKALAELIASGKKLPLAADRSGMTAIESRRDCSKARSDFEQLFAKGAEKLAGMGDTVFWHEDLGTWGYFGTAMREDGTTRVWNPFGQRPSAFRNHMIVEINTPPSGHDFDLQGAFARDAAGHRWLLHQGRMSISGKRITQSDFRMLSGLGPVRVSYRDGSSRLFHPVADLDQPARSVQAAVARFVSICSEVREASRSPALTRAAVAKAISWEGLLSPERTGEYEVGARATSKAEHRHGLVWKRLVAALNEKGIEVSNARVGQYGPDLYTLDRPLILFEIKSDVRACDLFGGIGQLQVYEKLMGRQFRKVLVIPTGAAEALRRVIPGMKIRLLEYQRKGRSIEFDSRALAAVIANQR